jgi:MoaA/NifB/PqqE/SkfB family radical SAM enzyme
MHSASREDLEKQGFSFSSMTRPMFENVLRQMSEFPKKIKKVTFSGFGEPLLDARLPEMIRMIKEKNVAEKILVISNGLLLTKELWRKLLEAGLDEIKISLQGMNSRKYKAICGADIDYDKFVEILMYAYANRGNCTIRIKVADTALDSGEEAAFYERFGKISDFIAIEHIYQQFSFVNYDGKLQTEYGKNRFGYDFKPVKVCSSMFFKLNVLQDGRITFGYPDGITFEGFNVNETTLYKVWNSPERNQLLVDNLKGNYTARKECETCTRWAYSVVPEDLLDGHEDEILARIKPPAIPESGMKKPIILCANNNNC